MLNVRFTYTSALIALLVGVGTLSNSAYLPALVAFVIAAGFLAYESRHEPQTVWLLLWLTLGLCSGLYGLGLAISGSETPWPLFVQFALLLAATVGSLVLWIRERRAGIEYPDVLGELFEREAVFEQHEVQWSATQSDSELSSDSQLDLFLQNCSQAERRCTVNLSEVTGVQRQQGFVMLPSLEEVILPPGAVLRLSVPLRPTMQATRSIKIYIELAIKGSRARRNRSVRGRPVDRRVGGAMQLAALAGGMLVWGGGAALEFASGGSSGQTEVLTVGREWLWQRPKTAN